MKNRIQNPDIFTQLIAASVKQNLSVKPNRCFNVAIFYLVYLVLFPVPFKIRACGLLTALLK